MQPKENGDGTQPTDREMLAQATALGIYFAHLNSPEPLPIPSFMEEYSGSSGTGLHVCLNSYGSPLCSAYIESGTIQQQNDPKVISVQMRTRSLKALWDHPGMLMSNTLMR